MVQWMHKYDARALTFRLSQRIDGFFSSSIREWQAQKEVENGIELVFDLSRALAS